MGKNPNISKQSQHFLSDFVLQDHRPRLKNQKKIFQAVMTAGCDQVSLEEIARSKL